MDYLADLAKTSKQITRLETRRAERMRERDALIRKALAAGHTWVEIQSAAGISPRAVKISLERSKPD